MRILLTGGTGFLGKRLVPRLLRDGHALLLFSRDPSKLTVEKKWRKKISFIKGDLADIQKYESRVRRFRPEAAIHLAWEGIPSDAADFNIRNLENGLRFTKTCAAVGVKAVVTAGSCHEYGEPGVGVDESAPLAPFNALYEAKVALHWLGAKFAAERGMAFIWLRPGFIYGPGQRSKALIPHLVDSLKRGETPALRTPDGGNDFVFVDDVAESFAKAVNKYRKIGSNVYNIGSGRLASVAEVARRVYHEFGIRPPKNFRENPRKVQGFWMDIRKAKKDLGWKPRVSLEKGIRRTVAALRNRTDS